MAAISVRDLDDAVKDRLRIRAARHGRSMEAEVRDILTEAVRESGEGDNFLVALHTRMAELGGVDLDIPARTEPPRAAEFPP